MAYKDSSLEEKAKARVYQRKYYHKPWRPECARNYALKRKFGITLEQYNITHAVQRGLCAICQKPETSTYKGKLRTLAVDHDHTTGNVRELLCAKCNTGIGSFDEDILKLQAAIEYLKKHSNG